MKFAIVLALTQAVKVQFNAHNLEGGEVRSWVGYDPVKYSVNYNEMAANTADKEYTTDAPKDYEVV